MAIMDSIIRGFDPVPVSATGYRAETGVLSVGGDAVNEAEALAKLGMKTAILCYAGSDPAGDAIMDELERSNVCTGAVIRPDGHPTPVTTIFVSEDGNRRSITNTAHSYNFHPEQYPEHFTDTRAVVLGSLFRAPFNDPEVVYKVVSAAGSSGALVCADCKLPNFRKLTLQDLSESLPLIDYITPNEDEARYYTGKEDVEEMADVFLETGVKNVIIKLGGNGCFLKNREFAVRLPAFNITAVDATGAGDNFIAGFVSELLRGSSPEDALRFASACGAVCSMAVGAGAGLTDRRQVLDFACSHKLK
jgi:sugar/nucleoside kinase (ribokinase family)